MKRAMFTFCGRPTSGFSAMVFSAVAVLVAFSGLAQPSPARQPFGIYARPDASGCFNYPDTNSTADDGFSNSIAGLISAFTTWKSDSDLLTRALPLPGLKVITAAR
jgi:hypothetical protein